jgi:hypothetical protein
MDDRLQGNRWWRPVFGFVAMMAISSSQYVWTLVVGPIGKKLGGSLAASDRCWAVPSRHRFAARPAVGFRCFSSSRAWDVVIALLAFFVLRRLRTQWVARAALGPGAVTAAG